jgi:hypothetical protein
MGWHDKEDDVSTIQLFEAVAKGCLTKQSVDC